MANLNRIILIGRLITEPETRSTVDGLAMAKFRLSVDRPQGGADLIDIVAWRNIAEAAGQTLKKGQLALVEGSIQIRTFNDQSGQKQWATEVIARSFKKLDTAGAAKPAPSSSQPEAPNEEIFDEAELASDLPF